MTDWQRVCDCLERRCWEVQQQQQQQLGLIVEGKEKAAVCWHLVTASHYCTDAIKYELDCLRVPRQRRCAPASFFFFFFVHACVENAPCSAFFPSSIRWLQCRGGEGGFNWDTAYVCRSEKSGEVSRTDCRFRLGRGACRDSSSRALSTYSNRFSCKLHASTLTKTKDRTINYRQIQVH